MRNKLKKKMKIKMIMQIYKIKMMKTKKSRMYQQIKMKSKKKRINQISQNKLKVILS